MPGSVFLQLQRLWQEPNRHDGYVGTLVNAYLARGGRAVGITAGELYFDVGTIDGYRSAMTQLSDSLTISRSS